MPRSCALHVSLFFTPECPICLRERLTRTWGDYNRRKKAARNQQRWWMKKPVVPETPNPAVPVATDEEFARLYPNLLEAMSSCTGEKGKPRSRHSIFLLHENGCFKACLKDKENGYEAWLSCVRLTDLFGLCEVACATGVAPWTKVKEWKKGKR